MRDDMMTNSITEEMVAAFLDGNATADEVRMIVATLPHSTQLQEIIAISLGVDRDLALGFNIEEILLKSAYAASSKRGNLCCWECEKHILHRHNISYNEEEMLKLAKTNMWLCESGTQLNNIGKTLNILGMSIEQHFNATLKDISDALNSGKDVIVAVDGGELLGDRWAELMEDIFEGEIPDHTVVVLDYNTANGTITLFDPNSDNTSDSYPIEQFMDAWNDSRNFMVTAKDKEYVPSPIDISNEILDSSIEEIIEVLSKNVHEVWAKSRMQEGWRYGHTRNDEDKRHPCIIPYERLSEGERDYDRNTVKNTLKLIQKLGYKIEKR